MGGGNGLLLVDDTHAELQMRALARLVIEVNVLARFTHPEGEVGGQGSLQTDG